MGLILEWLFLFGQGGWFLLSYQAFAASLWLVRNALRCEASRKGPSFSRMGLGVQKTWISGREGDIFCPLRGTGCQGAYSRKHNY